MKLNIQQQAARASGEFNIHYNTSSAPQEHIHLSRARNKPLTNEGNIS
jgi:hypothetical protein